MATTMDSPVRVFLVDDHSMFRAGVRAELSSDARINVIGDAGDVRSAVAGIRETEPAVVLLDVHMPDGGGLEVLLQCQAAGSKALFLGLSVSDKPEDVISLIRAGARGYVTKNVSGQELVEDVVRVSGGDAVFSPRLAGYVLDAFTGQAAPQSSSMNPASDGARDSAGLLDELTRREREVLKLLARGYTYKEMAGKLFISVKTVETHVSNILRKTQQTNRHALSRWVADHRLD